MAKSMLVTLPCVLLLLDYWPLLRTRFLMRSGQSNSSMRRTSRLVAEKLPLLALAAASCYLALSAHRTGGAVRGIEELPVGLRLENAAIAYVAYLGSMFWPVDLVPLYLHAGRALPHERALGAALILTAVTGWALAVATRRPYFLVGWLWYLGTLVPVIGLVQVGVQSMADRYTYVPLIGIFMAVSWGMADLVKAFHLPAAVPALAGTTILAVCAVLTWQQVGRWHDSIALWDYTVRVSPANDIAHNNLGAALSRKGAVDAAVVHYAKALELQPVNVDANINLGVLLANQGKSAEAAAHLSKAIELDPQSAAAHYHLGLVLAREGKIDPAITQWRTAIQLPGGFPDACNRLGLALLSKGLADEAITSFSQEIKHHPNAADARNNLGMALLQQGRIAEAREQFQESLQITPNSASAHANLGIALGLEGKPEAAEKSFEQAVSLEPQVPRYHFDLAHARRGRGLTSDSRAEYSLGLRLDPSWPEAANQSARLLATDAHASGRQGALAVRLAEEACEATDYERVAYLDTLAAAYAEAGRFEDAVRMAQKALTMAAESSANRPAIEARLRLYERRQPYHQPADARAISSP
jgi:tetratricopeptide (TPR) repeat protein